MLKKIELSEKLKKLKIEGVQVEKKDVPGAPDTEHIETVDVKEGQEGTVDVSQTKVSPLKKVVLKAKNIEDIEEKKPEDYIEPLEIEKRDLIFIKELTIPEEKLSKLFKIQTSYTEDTLAQTLTAWKDPEKTIKWTVTHDKHGEDFYSLKNEGLMKMKDNPPIYGMEFDDGAIIASHMGDYTFTMGCYNFDVKGLVKIFAFGIENAKRFNL